MTETLATLPPAIVIFIHGAWHWGGSFQKVADHLSVMGIPVAMPDLASHGFSTTERETVDNIDAYVAPVSNLIEQARIPVVLVGHSLGGVAVAHLCNRFGNRIAKAIYLTAFLPDLGETTADIIAGYANHPDAAELFEVVAPVDGGVRLDVAQVEKVRAAFYADCCDRDFEVARCNIIAINSAVPYGWIGNVALRAPSSVPRVFIRCTQDKAIPIEVQDAMIAKAADITSISIDAGHSPFFSQPQLLAEIIAQQVQAMAE